jgi:hypothetical protein
MIICKFVLCLSACWPLCHQIKHHIVLRQIFHFEDFTTKIGHLPTISKVSVAEGIQSHSEQKETNGNANSTFFAYV